MDHASWGYLASALLDAKEDIEAEACLRRAIEISADYQYATETLFFRQLKQNKLSDAEATLSGALKNQIPRNWALYLQLALDVTKRNTEAIETDLLKMTSLDAEFTYELTRSVNYLVGHDYLGSALKVLRTVITETETNEEVGAIWARLNLKQGNRSVEPEILTAARST